MAKETSCEKVLRKSWITHRMKTDKGNELCCCWCLVVVFCLAFYLELEWMWHSIWITKCQWMKQKHMYVCVRAGFYEIVQMLLFLCHFYGFWKETLLCAIVFICRHDNNAPKKWLFKRTFFSLCLFFSCFCCRFFFLSCCIALGLFPNKV